MPSPSRSVAPQSTFTTDVPTNSAPDEDGASNLGYHPALDGLRGVAILAVMLYHLLAPIRAIVPRAGFNGGFLGVDLFFVLSGFLITSILAREFRQRGSINLRDFWVRRALRLLPALAVVAITCLVLALLADAGTLQGTQGLFFNATVDKTKQFIELGYFPGILTILLPVSNFTLLAGYGYHPLIVAWSLAVEDQFYLLWPVALVVLLRRVLSFRALTVICVVAALGFAIWRNLLIATGTPIGDTYFRPDTRADQLLIGCALGLAMISGVLPHHRIARRALAVGAWVAALVLLVLLVTATVTQTWVFTAGFTAVGLAAAAVVGHVVAQPSGTMARALAWPALVGVGQISYGLYLWHDVWLHYAPGDISVSRPGLVLALSALTAFTSYYAVERPALRWKVRFTPTLDGRRRESTEIDAARLSGGRFRPPMAGMLLLLFLCPLLIIAQVAILLLQDAVIGR